jgi:predicted component of type VI protein secretion system
LAHIGNVQIDQITQYLKEKNFNSIRKWVATTDIDSNTVFRQVYEALYDMMKKESIPQAVLIIADYQYKNAFVADSEINLVACLTELMANCEFK